MLEIEERFSDSPFVERVWRSWSEREDNFISVAVSHWELVIWTENGKTSMSLQGPETTASAAPVPENATFMGIVFKLGVFMPQLAVSRLVNTHLLLPEANSRSFWFNGAAWEFPNYDNADTFVDWLVRDDLLVRDMVVSDVLQGCQPDISTRSVQRRFSQATGLTLGTIQQISRARRAAILLQQGMSILDTVYAAGYFDQPHLTRSMKYFMGQTPTQLMDKTRPVQLSFLYNTTCFD